MCSVDQKLDLLINSITKIEKKLDGFGESINKLEEIYKNQENRIEERFQRLNDYFEEKVKILSNRILDAETFKTNFKKAEVMRENYEKRMNILIHEIEEDTKSVWDSNIETRIKFNNFISGALKLDPTAIAIADIHRLPQRPKFKDGIKVTRPIIVKLVHTKDKNLIYQNLRELKSFNEEKKKKSIVNARPVYITDHFPKLFLRQKKALLPQFKQARKNKQKVFGELKTVTMYCSLMMKKFMHRQLLSPINSL